VDAPVIEVKYPLKFRKADAQVLGEHVRLRHNVDLVGMKRVGIGDFLSFFLYRRDIIKKYIDAREKHLLIPVDLNDLVEIKLFAFWILTQKRVVDAIEKTRLDGKVKKQINLFFLDSIESQDLFLAIENLRRTFVEIVKAGILPTIFFLRFDRMASIVNDDFFANLQGLREATGQNLSYVFTSFRSISEIVPLFTHAMYIKPAQRRDCEIILKALRAKYRITLAGRLSQKIVQISGGHAQYLYLSMLVLGQYLAKNKLSEGEILNVLSQDERLMLQSEEIRDSLLDSEREVIIRIVEGRKINAYQKAKAKYLWETGLVVNREGEVGVFSPLLGVFLKGNGTGEGKGNVEFTKKENLLFSLLLENLGALCEREKIIEAVWPEAEELGVSDWTIDRLAARLREKLKGQKSELQLITVKTRGFKLVKAL